LLKAHTLRDGDFERVELKVISEKDYVINLYRKSKNSIKLSSKQLLNFHWHLKVLYLII